MKSSETLKIRSRNKILKGILLVILLLLAGFLLQHFYRHNPEENPGLFYPVCTFKAATGWDCIGCGGQRALHSLLHLEFYKAFKFNALYISLIPLILYYIWYYFNLIFLNRKLKENFLFSITFGKFILVSVILFFFLRNIFH